MHEVLVNRLGGLSLPRKSVVRLTDRPDMTFDVYRGRKTTIQYNTILCQNQSHRAYPKFWIKQTRLKLINVYPKMGLRYQKHLLYYLTRFQADKYDSPCLQSRDVPIVDVVWPKHLQKLRSTVNIYVQSM